MNEVHLSEIDRALLVISEARECAARTARALKGEGGDDALIAALERADGDLLSVHGELMRAVYFPPTSQQLRLAG